ncbi:MAG: (2Fe-2S)-binding protein [Nitriliruptoraceae bacterium]|nr:(2Fe-2S)-binding protein [Nitriliruptoraceae bacterium]
MAQDHREQRNGAERLPLRVNGDDVEVEAAPMSVLADVLRDELGLTGTKLGCRAGDCGSCTVLVDGVAITSCLMPVAQAAGRDVTTIEGLETDGELHPVQQAFSDHNASQCGYCIPGFIVAAAETVANGEVLDREQVVQSLSGNLCRCTGYESIVDAIVDACGHGTDREVAS